MKSNWIIPNVRNVDVIARYARDRSLKIILHSPDEYMPDDTRWDVELRNLTWPQMRLLIDDIGDALDVDALMEVEA